MQQTERVRVIYSGNVHGVGFRFTAERVALKSGVTGFAKNLPDGTVEIVGEGSRKDLRNFMENIRHSMSAYISDYNLEWESAEGKFSSFEIRF
ncbi:MAG: acylphosphatase [Candidatus Omnitrophota bacterium]